MYLFPVWKKSIGKYWIQYFFRSKVLEIREKSTESNTYLPILFFHTGFVLTFGFPFTYLHPFTICYNLN